MSRNLSHFVVVALLMFLFTSTASAVELAVNGGFETGDFTGWTQFPGGGSQEITSVNPAPDSIYAANLNATADAAIDNLIKNANIGVGQVSAGDAITISFDARGTTTSGGVAFAEFFSEVEGGGVSDSQILGGAPLSLNADPEVWTNYSYDVFAGPDVSGGITLQLKAGCGPVTGCTSDVFFDNASVSVVPEPSSFCLIIPALGLLGLARRRSA